MTIDRKTYVPWRKRTDLKVFWTASGVELVLFPEGEGFAHSALFLDRLERDFNKVFGKPTNGTRDD